MTKAPNSSDGQERGIIVAARLVPSPRRGLRRDEAALYIGVSASKFDQLVRDGRMPKSIRIDSCVIWDIRRLDDAFDALTEREAPQESDEEILARLG